MRWRLPGIMWLVLLILAGPVWAAPSGQDWGWPTDNWMTTPPEAQGMDACHLAGFFDAIAVRDVAINSAVITRDGYLVAEMYTPPLHAADRQNLYSVAKSVTSIAVGIAWDAGHIDDLAQPAADYFPAWQDDARAAITLHDLLTMRSGLSWPDRGFLTTLTMMAAPDWVDFVLARPLATAPGDTFSYNSGNTHLLAAILQAETGQTMQAYVQAELFDPLGIEPDAYTWETDPQGITSGAWGLLMTARDAAKVGYVMLRDGQWDGQPVVSADWIARSTTPYAAFDADRTYGYQWWIFEDYGYYAAAGFGGQFIIVHPDLDIVAVITADLLGSDDQFPRLLYEEFVIPAVVADDALPANPACEAALAESLAALENADS